MPDYQPGDLLRVHRRRYGVPYTHYAINFPDDRVVEFGGSTANKPAMGVEFGPLELFAKQDRVDVVHHDDHDAALAMRRAEWLVSCPPTRHYNGIGFKCEHVARWCATGWETESLQIRHGVFGGKSVLVGLSLLLWVAWARGTNRQMPSWVRLVAGANFAATVVTQYLYHNEIRHFVKHIRENCPRELLVLC